MDLARLRKVTLDELLCRSRQRVGRWVDRLATERRPPSARRRPAAVAGDAADRAALERFLATAPLRFFSGLDRGSNAAALAQQFPGGTHEIVEAARRVAGGCFDLLGYSNLTFGTPVDWHFDPVANRRAPQRHWSRLDPLDPSVVGDSKVIWELNRHQWVVTLGQAYWLTGERRYADAALDYLDAWIDANPYGLGINWASSLEVALRLMAWCWTLLLVRRSPGLTVPRFARLRSLAIIHASHVERYLSYYFSPNTHLTGEALGLLYAGVVFADCGKAATWRDLGCRILIDELQRQTTSDGVYFEQATCYHRYTIEIYLQFLAIAARNGLPVPHAVRDSVAQMFDWLVSLHRADGRLPAIGDADGGWLLPLVRRDPSDCRGALGLGAALFERPDLAWAAGGVVPEVAWILGREGLKSAQRLGTKPPSGGASRAFADGGYAVMRSGWQSDAHQLIVDVGPLGCPVSGAHGHADLLSVLCTAFGEDFLVDAGTYCYTADPTWRNYFRSTAAHSTVVVDGQSQADPSGPFSWRARPRARLRAWTSTATHDFVDASHDGYTRLEQPVVHRRRVLFVKSAGWVVVDDLTGEGTHAIEIRFQFSPRVVSKIPGGWVSAAGRSGRGLWLAPWSPVPLSLEVHEGRLHPIDGWVSSAYGVRRPAPVAVYSGRTAMPCRIVTVLVPVQDLRETPPAVEFEWEPAAAPASVSIRFPDDERVIHVASDCLTIEEGERRLRIA